MIEKGKILCFRVDEDRQRVLLIAPELRSAIADVITIAETFIARIDAPWPVATRKAEP